MVAGQTIDILVAFSHAEGDDEMVTHTALETGVYLIQTWLFADGGCTDGNVYGLTVDVF